MRQLKVLKEFQEKHPTSHVGGSIGLMLRGVDLKRDFNASDLDITIDDYLPAEIELDNLVLRSDNNDFDFCVKWVDEIGNYTKMDIRITPEPSFDVINYNGVDYNVSKLRDILFWKKKYADKGVKKHIKDLITIEMGVRPTDTDNSILSW